jgi:hypothetical protein
MDSELKNSFNESFMKSFIKKFHVYERNESFIVLEWSFISACHWEGMDKSTLAHTQIQIIIIHLLPSPIPLIPNG